MGRQTELLDLQAIDTRIDRLVKERAEIPERAEADRLTEEASKLSAVLAALEQQLHDAERSQGRLDGDLSTLSEKIAREEKKLYGGTVANPKELEGLQEELRSLGRQRDELETALLEAMETVDESRQKVNETAARTAEAQAVRDAKEQVLADKIRDLEERVAAQEKTREKVAAGVAPELRELYEKVRQQKGGVAVGEVHDAICGACRVELPAEELDRMLNADGVWRCPQCRRILVQRS